MSEQSLTYKNVIDQAKQLSRAERAHLIAQLVATLVEEPPTEQNIQSLYGLLAGEDLSAEDIDEARREMWSNFPREDIG